MTAKRLPRMATGVAGLDTMLKGGVIAGSVGLLRGAAGTGKTTLGLQFLHHGAVECGEPGLLITFEQFPHTLYRDALALGWNLRELEEADLLRLVFTSPRVFISSLQDPQSPISQTIRELGVRRAVVDSVTHFVPLAASPTELRSMYNLLVNGLRREGITGLLISEDRAEELRDTDPGRLAFVVDAVILMRYVEIDSVMQRLLAVVKMRGSDHVKEIRRYEIKSGGLVVGKAFVGREGLLTGTPRRTR
jgi:circadian clock protein KaiC